MGASSLPRKNPFESQGLAPGLTLRVEFRVGELQESLVTQVQDVDESGISVLVPMQRLRKRPLPLGQTIRASYFHQRMEFRFGCEVTGHSPDGEVDYLTFPRSIRSSERRDAFRLQTALKPSSLFRLVIDPATANDVPNDLDGMVVDLSQGGMCISTRALVLAGERLGVQVELPQLGLVTARLRVQSVEQPARGHRNMKLHCMFTDLGRADRELIAKFLMRRQLEMRRRGQL